MHKFLWNPWKEVKRLQKELEDWQYNYRCLSLELDTYKTLESKLDERAANVFFENFKNTFYFQIKAMYRKARIASEELSKEKRLNDGFLLHLSTIVEDHLKQEQVLVKNLEKLQTEQQDVDTSLQLLVAENTELKTQLLAKSRRKR